MSSLNLLDKSTINKFYTRRLVELEGELTALDAVLAFKEAREITERRNQVVRSIRSYEKIIKGKISSNSFFEI